MMDSGRIPAPLENIARSLDKASDGITEVEAITLRDICFNINFWESKPTTIKAYLNKENRRIIASHLCSLLSNTPVRRLSALTDNARMH